jgi:uncharacterized surface protein with fasciclin (FAS1) repeats
MTSFPWTWLQCPVPQACLRAVIAVSLLTMPHTALAEPIPKVLDSGEFEIFSSALKKSGLMDRINSEDRVTLFIVSDKAMRDEGSAFFLEKVLQTKQNQQRLVALMSHHVGFASVLLPDQIGSGAYIPTSAGGCVSVFKLGTGIRVGPEAVVTDVKHVDSGVIYIVDRLLWQPWKEQDDSCGKDLARTLD